VREWNRRGLLGRRRGDRARVQIVEEQRESASTPDGSVQSRQAAEVRAARRDLDPIWTPEYLERLGRTYWLYLSRISLGLLRVVYTHDSRQVVLITRPFVLLRFHAPEYDISPTRGVVTWRIERGLLVARKGRGRGFLRLCVERPPESLEPGLPDDEITVHVSSEVENFYPTIAAPGVRGLIGRIMRAVYRITQLRLHVLVTHGFLRSLARLELPPSAVGALAPGPAEADPGGRATSPSARP
jgi:hypothetical protein